MKTSLITKLVQLEDIRRAEGTRHQLLTIVLITIMSIMSQCYSLRGIETFIKRHKQDLIKYLNIKKERVPSYSTVRRVLSVIDFDQLAELFKQWVFENNIINSDNWNSIDGKSIKSTMSNYHSSQQNFISIVTAFAHNQGIVLMSKSYQNKKTSEIPVVENLIKALDLQDITFTLDALHSKKNS
jgi:hypothetical protein